MAKLSAGLLVYRIMKVPEVLLVHPGGPLFTKKDEGVWSIPKGEYEATEDPLEVAKREFEEETGNKIKGYKFIALQPVKNKSGKTLRCWTIEEDFDIPFISSNSFEMEWPPKSGKRQQFPETDKAEWFDIATAKRMIYDYQLPLIEELAVSVLR